MAFSFYYNLYPLSLSELQSCSIAAPGSAEDSLKDVSPTHIAEITFGKWKCVGLWAIVEPLKLKVSEVDLVKDNEIIAFGLMSDIEKWEEKVAGTVC